MSDDTDLEEIFRAEAQQGLQTLSRELLALEQTDDETRPTMVRNVFRVAHTLKGAASSAGHDLFAKIAHVLESALDQLRRGERPLDRALVDASLLAVDAMGQALDGRFPPSELDEIGRRLVDTAAPDAEADAPLSTDPASLLMEAMEKVGAAVRSRSPKDAAAATRAFMAAASGPSAAAKRLLPLLTKVADTTRNGFEEDHARVVLQSLEVLFSENAGSLSEEELAITEELIKKHLAPAAAEVPKPAVTPSGPAAISEAPAPAPAAAPQAKKAQEKIQDARVPQQVLDQILFAVDELYASRLRLDHQRSAVDDLIASVGIASARGFDSGRVITALEKLRSVMVEEVDRLGVVVGGLHVDVTGARMAAVGPALEPFRRVVRTLATELGKEAVLEIEGQDVRVDRRVLDVAYDALTHLLRNALDHGLETPDVRAKNGKPRAGRIVLHVEAREGNAWFRVEDDGRGVDLERVRRVAAERNLIPADQIDRLNEEDTLELLFASGLSTASAVTNTSGRGVGLDAVRARVSSLGGSVRVSSTYGKGTQFHMMLPLHVSSSRGLMFAVGSDRYCLPLAVIQDVRQTENATLAVIDGKRVLAWRGEPLPFFDLHELNPVRGGGRRARWAIILSGDQRVALGVSELLREEDMVVKALAPGSPKLPFVMGAATVSDGALVTVLDSVSLVNRLAGRAETTEAQPAQAVPLVVVVDDSLTTRHMIVRLLEREGYRVIGAPDGALGYETVARERPSLVVTDVEMPNMTGFEMVAKIRGTPALARIPAIMITSLDSESDRAKGDAAGATAYIVKADFRPERFLSTVAKLVGGGAS